MGRRLFLFSFLWASFAPVFSQGFSARVIDFETKQPVPFATIQYGPHKGTITNEEGVFVINASPQSFDLLEISSMGYQSIKVKPEEVSGNIIYLRSQVIQLDDVFLTNKKLTGREILERVKLKVAENYNFQLTRKRFFYRESNINRVNRFDLDIDESTIADINQALMDSISGSIPKYSDSYKEVLGDFYGSYSHQKIQLIKAANLYNPQSTTSLDKLTKKLDNIFRENVKRNSYLKIKSGLFGVKVDADELAGERKESLAEAEEKQLTPEEFATSVTDKRNNLVSSANENISSVVSKTFWNEDSTFDLFDKLNRYKYNVKGYTYMGAEIVYVIEFEPKRGADYRGKVYVNTGDFGVHRIDFTNVKPLKKFRLLGISAITDVYRGKLIFSKDENGKYVPLYLERESGQSFGIDRPLTLIEKNKNVVGRRKQNELDMDVLINISQLDKYQFVVYDTEEIDEEEFKKIDFSSKFDYQTFKRYDSEFWSGFNIIEPNVAIKEFTALQTD